MPQKITSGLIIIIVLALCLSVTTFALVHSVLTVDGNLFSTGVVKIDLNGDQPIIRDDDMIFEPGATIVKPFYIRNVGTCDIYYRVYFENVRGGLADVIEVTVYEGDEPIYSGLMSELGRSSTKTNKAGSIPIGERRDLKISFHFPEDAGNSAKAQVLEFDLSAIAVQTKNNNAKAFE
jgi:hypothetical protein